MRVDLKRSDVTIISGGQTGADRGALSAALHFKEVRIGGHAPRGFRAEDGIIPEKYRLAMIEEQAKDYRVRTRRNVEVSDCSVILYPDYEISGGTLYTVYRALEARKPFLPFLIDIDGDPEEASLSLGIWIEHVAQRKFMDKGRNREQWLGMIINFAGSRESKHPGMFSFTRDCVGYWLDSLEE